MTQKQEQQQRDKSQIKPEAVELEDAQLERAQGGAIYMKVDGIAPTTTIKDGTSHISDGTSNTRF